MTHAMILLAVLAGQQQEPSSVLADEIQLQTWITQLSSPDFKIRKSTTDALKQQPKTITEKLKKHYLELSDLEAQLRLREIVEYIFFREAYLAAGGFLGIRPGIVAGAVDPRITVGAVGIQVEFVVPGSAAERSGLRLNDLIVMINDQDFDFDRNDPNAFSRRIRAYPPGTPVRFRVIRGKRIMNLRITLGNRPIQYINRDQAAIGRDAIDLKDKAHKEFQRWCQGVDGQGSAIKSLGR